MTSNLFRTARSCFYLLLPVLVACGGPPTDGEEADTLAADVTLGAWPTPKTTQKVTATIKVSGVFDGQMRRFVGSGALGTSGQSESQSPIFELTDGAVLKNVVLGNPAADGVHCKGGCTLQNVWWEDVGEDAATFKGTSSSQVMTIDGGGARHASDKVFQHNGPGTMIIKNFQVEDFGKLYRSCGNCSKQFARNVVIQNVVATEPGKALAGMNANFGDTARLTGLTLKGSSHKISVCDRYTGNSSGKEPTKIGSGPDGTVCIYKTSDVHLVSP